MTDALDLERQRSGPCAGNRSTRAVRLLWTWTALLASSDITDTTDLEE